MSFYDRLVDETRTERERFLSIPLLERAIESGVSRDVYIAFLGQAYRHVKQTCPLLELAIAHCAADDVAYRDGLKEYISEERGHEEWILDDIKALGGDDLAVRRATPGIPCRTMVGYAIYAIEHKSPYAMLGMAHVLEGISAQLAKKAAKSIAESLGLSFDVGAPTPHAGFKYLVSHGNLDQHHVRFFADLVNAIQDEGACQVIIETADVIYRLYGDIFRDLQHMERLAYAD